MMPKKKVDPEKYDAMDRERDKGPFKPGLQISLCNSICKKAVISFMILDNIAVLPCLALVALLLVMVIDFH
jgi:hypothetical protein